MQDVILGKIGKVELKNTSNGNPYTSFSVAESAAWPDKTTTWYDCRTWDKIPYGKGDTVLVIGVNSQNQKGDKVYNNFTANKIELIAQAKKQENDSSSEFF